MRVISNAGGVNPKSCAAALRTLVSEKGLDLKVAVITGDDPMDRIGEFADESEMFSGEPLPHTGKALSANTYLCACIHALGWKATEFDLLSAGSLAGHLIDCDPQATGGNFTDWRGVGDIAEIGYPIVEVTADGRCVIIKPGAYLLPDVTLEQDGDNRVLVKGAKGRAPSLSYKVSVTWIDGFRAGQTFLFNGYEADDKARAFAEAIFERTRKKLRGLNAGDFEETSVEIFGEGGDGYSEVMLKLAARHRDARAIGLFLKEMAGLGLATPAEMSAFTGGGRPKPSPVVRLFSFLTEKSNIEVRLALDGGDGETVSLPFVPDGNGHDIVSAATPDDFESESETVGVPLNALAVARSGDKGDKANIGIMARQPQFLPAIWASLNEQAVAEHFANYLEGGETSVARFYLPGSHAINFLLDTVLGRGGTANLPQDAQAKGYGQKMFAKPVTAPAAWVEDFNLDRFA